MLALGTLGIARLYPILFHPKMFILVLFGSEITILCIVLLFIILGHSHFSALSMYIGYQIVFLFGSYLPRYETLLLRYTKVIQKIDETKQKGYIFGLFFSFIFYKVLAYYHITSSTQQVILLFYLLLSVQTSVLIVLFKASLGKINFR